MQKENKAVGKVLDSSTNSLERLADVNLMIGNPITTISGFQVIPFSKVTMGSLAGGGEYGDVKVLKEGEEPSFAGGSDNNVPSFEENDAGASPFGSGNDSSEGASPFGISSQEEAGASPFGNPVSSEGDSPFGSSAGDSPFENQEKQEDLPSPFSVPVERTETLTPMSMPIADGMAESLLENKSVIRLGKTDFAVGLFWQPLQNRFFQ